jgi:hypothetical protein
LAKEAEAADGLLRQLAPGIYHLPHCADMKEMGSPEMLEKMKRGPNAMVIVLPNGAPQMGKALGLWFLYTLLVGLFCAYIAGRTLAPGRYLAVFRIVRSVAFVATAFPTSSIRSGRLSLEGDPEARLRRPALHWLPPAPLAGSGR